MSEIIKVNNDIENIKPEIKNDIYEIEPEIKNEG